MKKVIFLVLAVSVLLFASTLPGYAGGHFRGNIWIGPGWGPPAYPYYYYAPYYAAPPVIIERQAPVYVQPAPQPEEQNYWYFCTRPEGYYPYVKQCPGGWMKVVPPTAPPDFGARSDPAPQGQSMKGNPNPPPDIRAKGAPSPAFPDQGR